MSTIRVTARPLASSTGGAEEATLDGRVERFGSDQLLVDKTIAAQLVELLGDATGAREFDVTWDGVTFQRCCVIHPIADGTVVEYIDVREARWAPPQSPETG
jgi:hypothetical protein